MGYLVAVLVVAVPTFLAVVAPRRTPLQARLSFLGGLVVNEMPLWPALWVAGATALAAADGTLRTVPGGVGAALAAVTLVGLAVILRRGLAARPVLVRALADAGLTRAAAATRRGPWRDLAAGLFPFVVRSPRIVRRRDIAYGPHGRRNLLDVYQPRRPTRAGGTAPVLVYFHGGGYASGRKDREARLLMHRAVRRGWVAVSAAYRLRPDAGMPEHLADADAAIAWVRAHAVGLGADPDTVVIAGSSAGAHLASVVALRRSRPGRAPATSTAATPRARIAAVVGLYGWYGGYFGDATVPANPGDLAHADAPPFVLLHGDQDTYVPPAMAQRLAARLRAVSRAPVVHAELPGAQHGFDLLRSPRFSAVTDAVLAVLDEVVPAPGAESLPRSSSWRRGT